MPIAMTPEQLALQASLRDWAKRAAPITVARAMEPAAPEPAAHTALLDEVTGLGIFAIPQDGTVTDLAAALEQLACALTPGPVLPTALAALLLTRAGARDLPARAGVALSPGTPGPLTGTRRPDGGAEVTGETGPVLWAAGPLLAAADDGTWFLIDPDRPGVTVTRLPPLDFSRELAAIRLDGAVIPPENLLPALTTDGVRDLAATLFAALGIDPSGHYRDPAGRPFRVAEGRPVRGVYG